MANYVGATYEPSIGVDKAILNHTNLQPQYIGFPIKNDPELKGPWPRYHNSRSTRPFPSQPPEFLATSGLPYGPAPYKAPLYILTDGFDRQQILKGWNSGPRPKQYIASNRF